MNGLGWSLILAGLLGSGGLGAWLCAHHEQVELDALHEQLTRSEAARTQLQAQLDEQSRGLEDLRASSEARARQASEAVQVAETQAGQHEARARQLLRDVSVGDECVAVRQLIDAELLP
ncbi:MAG: hypothetical protein GAK44_00158 [Pseudomonas delhiensis]|nr:MAG: hypothetical protein GAK44_00158 [Pseudomonas delhiensis]